MDQKERDDIMERVKDGRVLVLTNYGVCTTGFDCPRWTYLVCARPTKSFSLWRQMGGRISRPFENHDHAVIQDHSDNATRFGYPDEDVAWELNTDCKAQDLPRNCSQQTASRKQRRSKGVPMSILLARVSGLQMPQS